MKEKHGFYWPDSDQQTSDAVLNEWNHKSEYVMTLCKNRNLCVQAGGNVGVFPIKLSRVFRRVISFEPHKPNIACFKHNVTLRGIENVELHEAALGSEPKNVGISYAPKENCGATQVGGTGDIPTILLDELDLPALDLMWLDVEGSEMSAIAGALNTIHKYNPVIIIENKGLIPGYPSGLNGNQEVREIIEDFGYEYVNRIMRDDFFIPKGK